MKRTVNILSIMILIVSLFIGCASASAPDAAATDDADIPCTGSSVFTESEGMDYWTYIPEYAGEDMPVIVWLHGINSVGKPQRLDSIGAIAAARNLNENRFIIIQPCTLMENWTDYQERVSELVDDVVAKMHCDENRVILTGYSLGAMGVWHWADHSDKWAAIVPVAGKPITGTDNVVHSDVPLLAIWGEYDDYGTQVEMQRVVEASLEAGTHKDARYYVMPETNHSEESSIAAYTQEVFDWMYAQSK